MSDKAQLYLIWKVFTDTTAEEELYSTAHERTCAGTGQFSAVQKLYNEDPIPNVQIVVHHHGAPVMVGYSNGFVAKFREDEAFMASSITTV